MSNLSAVGRLIFWPNLQSVILGPRSSLDSFFGGVLLRLVEIRSSFWVPGTPPPRFLDAATTWIAIVKCYIPFGGESSVVDRTVQIDPLVLSAVTDQTTDCTT